jgi:hypothetical protein
VSGAEMMESYDPRSLPEVVAVEIVDLGDIDIDPSRVVEQMATAVQAHRVRVRGDIAARIAELWRALPAGEAVLCHIPPYGLRFFNSAGTVCQASICWRCNNLYGDVGGRPIGYEFDSEHPTAQRLLQVVRENAVGVDWNW